MLKLFNEHPKSVGETYWQHLHFASRTGVTMLLAGCACILHGLCPFLFTTTGSRTIRALAARLGGAQPRHVAKVLPFKLAARTVGPINGMDRPAVVESLTSAAL
jgi:hypothetical protein